MHELSFFQRMNEYEPAAWALIPDLGLYMDQVVTYIERQLESLYGAASKGMLTPSMINNYVKMKLAAPAVKKKYDREHMARFVMICLLKKVLSMTEITAVLDRLLLERSLEEGYDLFCGELELRLRAPEGPDSDRCPAELATAVRAVACKILLEQMIQKDCN